MRSSIESLTEPFIRYLRTTGYAVRTIDHFRLMLRLLSRFAQEQGAQTVREITRRMLGEYQSRLLTEPGARGKPLTADSQAHHIGRLKIFFRYLVRQGLLLVDPACDLETPHVPRRPPTNVLDLAGVEKLLRAPDVRTVLGVRDRAMLELLYSSGLRVSELAGLDVYDIDLAVEELRVRRGKGGKSRLVPVGKIACQWVGRYLREVRPQLARRRPHEVALFVSGRGRRLVRQNLARIVSAYGRAAGLRLRVTPHGLRHAFATHMLRGKASLRHLQEMLGHVKLTTTQIYTQVDITDLKNVHRRCHPRGRH